VSQLAYDGHICERLAEESVLDALLRSGLDVPHSCRAGVCGSCLMRAVSPEAVPQKAQTGLKDTWKASGYFLACLCRPESDFSAMPVGADVRVPATIAALDRLSDSVLRVRLATETAFDYRPGQYLTLLRDDGLARSYSLASLPREGRLELHVRLIEGGRMSQWLDRDANIGTTMSLIGPSGDCFYVPGREDQSLLLAGTGTGLAPLYGIARDALAAGHRGPVHLVHGVPSRAGLYLRTELLALADGYPNFTYTASVLDEHGPLDKVVLAAHPSLKGWRAYVCGNPTIVQRLRKTLFLSGATLNDIHADAFLPSA
jgi:CDP-4-dehydro-6-deoxyglucose reductase